MSDQPPASEAGSNVFQLPSRTTPTWEVEILLSGATVFALFQAYSGLTALGMEATALLPSASRSLTAPLMIYLQAGVLALALGFLLHLLLRALWVAKVGLRSVDPTGSVRESANLGPIQRGFVAEAWAALPQRIHALDDWASLTFSLALGLAQMMVGLMGMMLAMAGIALLIGWASGGRWDTEIVVLALCLLMLLPMMLAGWLDSRSGKLGVPAPRGVRWVLELYRRAGVLADNNLAMQVLTHRMSYGNNQTRGLAAVMGVMTLLLFIVGASSLWQQGAIGKLATDALVRSEVGQHGALRSAHYARTRRATLARAPYIHGPVVNGAYLRLELPVVDDWHHAPLRDCVARQGATDEDA
jgi:hypothetical protein